MANEIDWGIIKSYQDSRRLSTEFLTENFLMTTHPLEALYPLNSDNSGVVLTEAERRIFDPIYQAALERRILPAQRSILQESGINFTSDYHTCYALSYIRTQDKLKKFSVILRQMQSSSHPDTPLKYAEMLRNKRSVSAFFFSLEELMEGNGYLIRGEMMGIRSDIEALYADRYK